MRTAFYADYFARHKRPLSDHLVLAAERFSPITARLAPFLAPFWPLLARLGGAMTGSVDLPASLATGLPKDLLLRETDLSGTLPQRTVIVVQDWFTALFDAEVQLDVVAGLTALGYRPRLLQMRPAGKSARTAGDMKGFAGMAARLADLLHRAAATGAPLVAFEPAFAMMLRQEYVKAGITLPKVRMPQEFLAAEAGSRTFPQARSAKAAKLLSHCTEATADPQSGRQWAEVFAAIGATIAADEFLPNMATDEFLACLSRPALERSCANTSVLPRQKVKDTRAALVEHFKEGRFVHAAALFAPDGEKLSAWLSRADDLDCEDVEAAEPSEETSDTDDVADEAAIEDAYRVAAE